MNILHEILNVYGSKDLQQDIHSLFQRYFEKNRHQTFLLTRHSDPGMKEQEKIRVKIIKGYEKHVLVAVLNKNDDVLYHTTIAYMALLDRDNAQQQGAYELVKIYTRISIVQDEE